MSTNPTTRKLALFCDFENIAMGVRDASYTAFDIQKVLERLLLKGSIVVKQALKRRKPGFNETYHGFRTFGKLLELERDEKSGDYIIRSFSSED